VLLFDFLNILKRVLQSMFLLFERPFLFLQDLLLGKLFIFSLIVGFLKDFDICFIVFLFHLYLNFSLIFIFLLILIASFSFSIECRFQCSTLFFLVI